MRPMTVAGRRCGQALRGAVDGCHYAEMSCSHCEPWRLADAASALTAVAGRVSLAAGSSYVAVFDLAGKLVGARLLTDDDAERVGYPQGSRAIRTAVAALISDDVGPRPPEYVTHVIRCHDRYVVWGPDEPRWGYALIYGVQMLNTFVGEVIVLTPHGWTTGRRRATGHVPTLTDLAPTGSVVPLRRRSPDAP